MRLSKKVKTALDETRMLILGGQILLGFGLRGAFAEGFDKLAPHLRYFDAAGLGLMVLVVALLIAPEPYHRIVEGGDDSDKFHRLVTDVADLVLLPFGVALGVDIYVDGTGLLGDRAAGLAGAAFTLLALVLWYGLPRVRRAMVGQEERKMAEREGDRKSHTALHIRIEQLLTEARVILPGAQALFGFQLAIVLTNAFEQLPQSSRLLHAASAAFVAVSVMLLMAPAAYHRIVYCGEDSEEMHRTGSIMVTAATLPLAIGLAVDIHVVVTRITENGAVGAVSGAVSFALMAALWYGYPVAILLTRRGRSGRSSPAKVQGQSG